MSYVNAIGTLLTPTGPKSSAATPPQHAPACPPDRVEKSDHTGALVTAAVIVGAQLVPGVLESEAAVGTGLGAAALARLGAQAIGEYVAPVAGAVARTALGGIKAAATGYVVGSISSAASNSPEVPRPVQAVAHAIDSAFQRMLHKEFNP